MKKVKEVRTRHKIITGIIRPFLYIYIKLKFKFKYKAIKLPKTPHLILVNHTMAHDPLITSLLFRNTIYYVASDQIFNMGFLSKLIVFLVKPIPKAKSISDLTTTKRIINTVKQGGNISIFVEGNVTMNGENPETPHAISKLIKHLKIPVVLLTFEGAYLSDPRWSYKLKRGLIKPNLKQIWQYDEYKDLSNDEVYEHVKNTLYLNAYEPLVTKGATYIGKDIACGLERLMFVCPKCQKLSTFESNKTTVTCRSCNNSYKYDEHGYLNNLETNEAISLLDFDKQQRVMFKEYMDKFIQNPSDKILFEDKDVELLNIQNVKKYVMGIVTLRMYNDRITLTEYDKKTNEVLKVTTQLFSDTTVMCIQGKKQLIVILKDGTKYSLRKKYEFSPYKYTIAYQYMNNMRGENDELLSI